MVRVQDDLLVAIDRFRTTQFEQLSRPEAMRLLAEIGLESLSRLAPRALAERKKRR